MISALTLQRSPGVILTPAARAGLTRPPFMLAIMPAMLAWGLFTIVAMRGIDLQLCLTVPGDVLAGIGASLSAAWLWANPAQMALEWAVMVSAMMLPTLVPSLAHVCARSFRARRWRAATLFVLFYMAVWMAAGVVAALMLMPARAILGQAGVLEYGTAIGCVMAALWQMSRAKVWAARRCHVRPALAASGAAADQDVALYGLRHGLRCVASCFMLMVPPMLGPHSLLVMALVTLIVLRERAMPRPDFKGSAVVLLVLAVAVGLPQA